MFTSASWKYNASDIRTNVAYDFLTSEDPGHASDGGDLKTVYRRVILSRAISWEPYAGTNSSMYTFVVTTTTEKRNATVPQ
ncbi:hypothetical protein VTG60DRAFT_1898 [Thermothelomyces hinnuleus]